MKVKREKLGKEGGGGGGGGWTTWNRFFKKV